MRAWLWMMLAACSSAEPRLLPEPLAALEAAYVRTPDLAKTFSPDDLILGPTGLFVRGGRRATHMDLVLKIDAALGAAPQRDRHSLVVMPGTPPAAIAMVTRAAARRGWLEVHIGAFEKSSIRSVCLLKPRFPVHRRRRESDTVDFSVYVQSDRIWLGLSLVNEFQEVPNTAKGIDYEKLSSLLLDYKKTSFFVDRDEIEIGADHPLDLETWLRLIEVTCERFHSIMLGTADELNARPTL